MNQVFAGATALILALLLWALGKNPSRSLISKRAQHNVGALKLQQVALVETSKGAGSRQQKSQSIIELDWKVPTSAQERIRLQKQLHQLMAKGPEERLKAVILADRWGHATVLPILRRALKDSDNRVMVAAASAFQKHRGVPSKTNNQMEGTSRPPRNVARMR